MDQMNYFWKQIRLKICFSFLIITTVSKFLFAENLTGYAGVTSKMHVGVHGNCLLVLPDFNHN
jgi:hypothetical protein